MRVREQKQVQEQPAGQQQWQPVFWKMFVSVGESQVQIVVQRQRPTRAAAAAEEMGSQSDEKKKVKR